MTSAIETYLEELHAIRSSGAAVRETSRHGALFIPGRLKNTDEEAPLLGIPQLSRTVLGV